MVKKTTAKDGDHVVTMREVAKAAGVSIKTVSNVVNDYEFVSDATRAKVHKAIDELGYVINVSARNLRRGSTGIIALAIPDLQLSYFAQLSSLIITEAKKLGLRVIVEPTLYSREGELDALHGSQTAMVDGLIYSPLELGPDDAAEVEVDYPLVLPSRRTHLHRQGRPHRHRECRRRQARHLVPAADRMQARRRGRRAPGRGGRLGRVAIPRIP